MDVATLVSIASALFSLIAIAVSYYTFLRSLKASSRPVLVFSLRSEGLWQLQNVGSGPALGVVVGESGSDRQWSNITNCYPLSAGASIPLPWLKHALELAALYTDIHGGTFTTRCSGNQNKISEGNEFSYWNANQHEWIQLLVAKAAQLISEKDLEGLSPFELDIKRNEIYARHGYIFTRADLAAYFNKQDWYIPTTRSKHLVERQLTEDEKAIARFILHYQTANNLKTPKHKQEILSYYSR